MLSYSFALVASVFALPALAGFQDFGIPASSSTVDIKAFNVANFTLNNLAAVLVSPVLPGRESITLPIHAYLIQHQPSNTTFMFDLGMRNDPQNLPPGFAGLFDNKNITFEPFKDITELLQEGGVSLDSIEMVFWSHAHFDHIGDMSKFPQSTKIVVNEKTNLTIFPDFAGSDLQASDLSGHNVETVDFEKAKLVISGMPAVDFFGDGSFYLLDTPGHLVGHMTGLARVTPTSFIVLGADAMHHAGELRPVGNFLNNFPCPSEILEEASKAISTDFFWSTKSAPGSFDLPSRAQPLFSVSDIAGSFYVDPVAATVSVDRIAVFDADPDFFVLFTHDASITGVLPYFPQSVSDWQKEGLKERSVWLFIDPENDAFAFSPA
ncbi:beta-lactamase-like protein [Roridomyces roridus]|uniref:Beta-lactamase-like protein n=1 Tax=Roridomyces roridus TaxID=1738132 RepID=A0AAD7BQC2_9AGAR|nr:beta-lactamase-like protein [Roridomyces roridus]